jgi:hypothetical protein
MFIRSLLLFGAVSMAAAQTVPPAPAASSAPQAQVPAQQAPHEPVIRFEDATDKTGMV